MAGPFTDQALWIRVISGARCADGFGVPGAVDALWSRGQERSAPEMAHGQASDISQTGRQAHHVRMTTP
jgi:hypothetical protein